MTTASGSSSIGATIPAQTPADRFRRRIAVLARWLHVYLSMFSFAVVLFFAATGLTLNHPDWFGGSEQTVQNTGIIPTALLRDSNGPHPDKLAITELIRKAGKITAPVTDFRIDDTQIDVSFKGPGYSADAFIDPTNGSYGLSQTRSGLIAVINDLHRGQNAGRVWSAAIDACAIFLILISLTGLVLILFLNRRRKTGLLLVVLGAILCILVYRTFVG